MPKPINLHGAETMPTSCSFWPLLLFLPTFCFPFSFLHSQIFPEDIRLSSDIKHVILPEDAKIQSAARIGDLTLVVWGSSRAVTSDSVANVLYWQRLRDTVRLGEPHPLTDDRFDPFGFVQVVVLENHFLVVWNDRGGGNVHTWYTVADTTGIHTEPALFWSHYPLTERGVDPIRQRDGTLVLWSDTVNEVIMGRIFDIEGGSTGEAIRIDTGFIGNILPAVPEPEMTLIDRGNRSPLIIRYDGTTERIAEESAEKFTGTFYIDNTGSVLVVDHDTIRRYSSISDSVPDSTAVLSLPENRIPGSTLLFKSSAGQWILNYSVAAPDMAGAEGYVWIYEYLVPLDLASANDASEHLGTALLSLISRPGGPGIFVDTMECAPVRGCGQSYVKRYKGKIRGTVDPPGPDSYPYDQVDSAMIRIVYESSKFSLKALRLSEKHLDLNTLLPKLCTAIPEVQTERYRSRSESKVAVSIGSTWQTVVSPAAQRFEPVSYQFPGIISSGKDFLIPAGGFGPDSLTVVWRWDGKASDSIPPFAFPPLPLPDGLPSEPNACMKLSHIGDHSLLQFFRSYSIVEKSTKLLPREYRHSSHLLYQLTDTGWNEIAHAEPVHQSHIYGVLSAAQDTENRSFLVATGWLPNMESGQAADSISVTAYSSEGTILWRADSLKTRRLGFHLVPLEDRRFAGIGFDKQIYQFSGDSLLESGSRLPFISQIYRPYYGESFLWAYTVGNGLHIEQRSSRGALIKSTSVPMQSGAGDYAFCLNPSDSGILILYRRQVPLNPAENGIYFLSFDKELRMRKSDRISVQSSIAVRPAGIFRNDTLFVVWEDLRNGASDIYANAVGPNTHDPLSEVRKEPVGTENLIAAVIPNPAHDVIGIRLEGIVQNDTHIELWNMLGRCMLRQQMGTGRNEAVLNVKDLPEGTFLLVVRKGNCRESRMLHIAR